MSKLPDDAIGIYHWMFDFSGVRIHFSLFLLALIKHYRVHFSQLDPLGLNKVITFEHWKSVFFLSDRRDIPDAMVWRHPDAAIDDPRPVAGSYSMADVRRLSAHVIKLRDMPEGVSTLQRLPLYYTPPAAADAVIPDPTLEDLAVGTPSSKILSKAEASQKQKASTSGATSSHVAKHTRSVLAQSSGSTTHPSLFVGDSNDESDGDDDACVEIPLVTPIRSAAVIPSSRNQGESSTTPAAEDSQGKGIMVDDAAVPSGGASRTRPSSSPAPTFRDATYPEGGVAGNCEFTREEWDAPYRPTFGVLTEEVFKDLAVYKTMVDQFPTPGEIVRVESLSDDQLTAKISAALYDDVAWWLNGYEEKVASLTGLELQVSALKKQVSRLNYKLSSSNAFFAKSKAKGKEKKKKIKIITKSLDNLHAEVAHLSTALNQAIVLEAEKDEEILWLKATALEFLSFFRGQFQGLVHKFLATGEFSRVQGELLSLVASAGFKRGLSIHRTKDEFAAVLKKMANFISGAQDRLAKASPLLLEPEKLVRSTNVLTPRDAHVSPPITKESTVTPTFKSLELSANVDLIAFVVASEHNEEMVNVEIDGSDPKMTDDIVAAKSGHAFVQGVSVALDDVVELVGVGSGRVSSGPNYVVVSLSAGEKGGGLIPSFVASEEAAVNSSRCVVVHPADPESCHPPKAKWLPPGTCSIAGQASVGSMG
ncbi:hypothetical protein Tco_0453150 [Tanacetum coccineum]